MDHHDQGPQGPAAHLRPERPADPPRHAQGRQGRVDRQARSSRSARRWACSTPSTASTSTEPGPRASASIAARTRKGNDQYDDVQLLKAFSPAANTARTASCSGPDKHLYVINGNHTDVPEGLAADSPHRNYQEDLLLPRQWDGNGHAAGRLAPGGYVLRTDADGKMGADARRLPQRLRHRLQRRRRAVHLRQRHGMGLGHALVSAHPRQPLTSAAEFGWRSGTGKWPDYYPDSLPAIAERRHRLADRRGVRHRGQVPGEIPEGALRPRLDLWPADRRPSDAEGLELHGHLRELRRTEGAQRERRRRRR